MSKEEKFKKTLQQLLDERQFAFEEGDWEAAKKVIDENRRKRRFLPLWFVFTGLVIFMGTLMVWPEAKPLVDQTNKHIEQNNLASTTNAALISEKENSFNETHAAPAIAQSKAPAISKNRAPAPGQQTPKPLIASPVDEVSLAPNAVAAQKEEAVSETKPAEASEKTKLPVVAIATANQSSQEENKALVSIEEKTREVFATSVPLTALETTSPVPLEEAKATEKNAVATASALPKDTTELAPVASSALIQPEVKKNMLWSVEAGFNVLYGWNSPAGTEGRGFNPVLGLNYHNAITDRFDYSLGLHFTSIAHLGAYSDTSKITKYNFGEESQVTVISPQTFYYLNVPLRFSWNFGNKQSLGTALELGYLLNVKSTVETYEESFTTGEKQSTKELGYTEGVAPFNFQMGFFYRRELFKNLYIQPELFFGLVDLKDDAFFNYSGKERSSGLKLTLLYSIKNR